VPSRPNRTANRLPSWHNPGHQGCILRKPAWGGGCAGPGV